MITNRAMASLSTVIPALHAFPAAQKVPPLCRFGTEGITEHEPSYWAATGELAPATEPLDGTAEADVGVISGGYTGLEVSRES